MEQQQLRDATEQAKRNLYDAGFDRKVVDALVDAFYASGEEKGKLPPIVVSSNRNGELSASIDLNRTEGIVYYNGFTGIYKPEIQVMDAYFSTEKFGGISESSRSLEDRLIKYVKEKDTLEMDPEKAELIRYSIGIALARLPEIDPAKGFDVRNQLTVKYLKDTPYQDIFGKYEDLANNYKPKEPRQAYFPYAYNEHYTEKYTVGEALNMFEGRAVEVYVKPFASPERVEQLTQENDPKKLESLRTFIGFAYLNEDLVSKNGNIVRGYIGKRLLGADGAFEEPKYDVEKKLSSLMITNMRSADDRSALIKALYNGDAAEIRYVDKDGQLHQGTAELRPFKGIAALSIKDEHGMFVPHSRIQSHDLSQARAAVQAVEKLHAPAPVLPVVEVSKEVTATPSATVQEVGNPKPDKGAKITVGQGKPLSGARLSNKGSKHGKNNGMEIS